MTCLSVLEKNGESETPSPRLRSPRRVLENFRSFANPFVVSTFTAQKKPVGWLAEIHLAAGAGVPGYNSATAWFSVSSNC